MINNTLESNDGFWQEIRLVDCCDGQFCNNQACQSWTRQLALFVVNRLGISPRIRIRAYQSGKSTLIAVDASSSQTDKGYVDITILLSESRIYLASPADNQFDIELPGIVDALNLIESIFSHTRGILKYPQSYGLADG